VDSCGNHTKIIGMRKVVLSLFMVGIVFGQSPDSLFWFHPDSAKEPSLKWPLVINQVFSPEYWGLVDSTKTVSRESEDGFRVQIFETQSANEAQSFFRESSTALNDSVYLTFDAPFYKIRVGNCIARYDAIVLQKELKNTGYKTTWIVRTRIE